ncbi:VanZ family protein [Photobacterium sp. Hal280]|uniref:VanZ family protein n=1 Tax=Photobacterium sp. Hal280 TaxID=3035163 RepID=UPI00301CFF3B
MSKHTEPISLYVSLKARQLLIWIWLLFILYGVFIAGLTLMPAAEKGSLADLDSYGISGLDKLLHGLTYMLFAMLALCVSRQYRFYTTLLVGLMMFGSLLEVFQGILHLGRESSFSDAVANLSGVMLGGLLSWYLERHAANKSNRNR